MAHSVHVVFYKHLTSWLLYGHLEDVHKEFFIQKSSDQERSLINEDVKVDIDKHESTSSKKLVVDMWDYNIQIVMLPSYIRPSLASKILTIGQTVIMFGNDPRQKGKKGNFTNKGRIINFLKKKKKKTFRIVSYLAKYLLTLRTTLLNPKEIKMK